MNTYRFVCAGHIRAIIHEPEIHWKLHKNYRNNPTSSNPNRCIVSKSTLTLTVPNPQILIRFCTHPRGLGLRVNYTNMYISSCIQVKLLYHHLKLLNLHTIDRLFIISATLKCKLSTKLIDSLIVLCKMLWSFGCNKVKIQHCIFGNECIQNNPLVFKKYIIKLTCEISSQLVFMKEAV